MFSHRRQSKLGVNGSRTSGLSTYLAVGLFRAKNEVHCPFMTRHQTVAMREQPMATRER